MSNNPFMALLYDDKFLGFIVKPCPHAVHVCSGGNTLKTHLNPVFSGIVDTIDHFAYSGTHTVEEFNGDIAGVIDPKVNSGLLPGGVRVTSLEDESGTNKIIDARDSLGGEW